MADRIKGKAVVGQSGGPTMVINQSLVGVIEQVRKYGEITGLLGAHHGVRGIVNEDFIPLDTVDQKTLEAVAVTPSAGLGSTRDKPDADYCQKIFNVFQKNDVRYFFYIGGNDSADTANIVNQLAGRSGYDLRVYHIPKTIDNDLRVTDHCPGFGSAAKFVISAFMGDDMDNRSLPGIKINVVMGRNAGFLTAASMLARVRQDAGPHLIYVPEVNFDEGTFLKDVDAVMKKYNRCVVAVSEGIHDKEGNAITTKIASLQERDAHGNVQLSGTGALGDFLSEHIKTNLGKKLRVRADTFGYLQRSFAGIYSEVDAREARLVGQKAVDYAVGEGKSGSVAIKRVGNGSKYAIDTFPTELTSVARETKPLPAEYISPEGNNINDTFRDYVAPLVGKLPMIGYLI
ncbi:MAG: 6-phosphofructokinase [Phycisphaerae bacterium]